jgi:hypothetical protein
MTICTSPKAFNDFVETQLARYEGLVEDDTLNDIESTSYEGELERLYAYREAIKNKDYDFIRAQGIVINTLEEKSRLATEKFLDVFGVAFPFTSGNSSTIKRGLFQSAKFVNGGMRITYKHKDIPYQHVFSLTSSGRSTTNEDDKFIVIPEFREFLDEYNMAEYAKENDQLVLGSGSGKFKLSDDMQDEDYVHGNVDKMKDMLKSLHTIGGEKADDAELGRYLDLIDKMKPKFFDDLKLYIQKDAETSKGMTRPSRIDIKIKGDPISIGNQQSEASIYLEEVIHSMTTAALKGTDKKALKLESQLRKLVEAGRKQLTWEDFLPADKDSINKKKEEEFAKRLYTYIFNNPDGNGDFEYLAKGIAQPEVAKALSKVKVREEKESKSVLSRLMDIFSFVLEVLTGEISIKNKNKNVHDALVQLAYELGEINSKASKKIINTPSFFSKTYNIVLNDTDRKLSDGMHKLTAKFRGQLSSKEYKNLRDNAGLYERTKHMAKTITLGIMNPVYTKVMGAQATALGFAPDGTVREVISNLFQTDPVQKVAEFLTLQAGYIDKKRNQQIALTRDNILSEFKNLPTRGQEEALTSIYADTDLAALVGKESVTSKVGITRSRVFDNATIRKLLEDDAFLDKYIKDAKRALKELDGTHYNWHSNQAVGLGIYMAKHLGTPEQNLNAENIAKGIHSSHRKTAKKNVVEAIDELSTLVAIKNSSYSDRSTTAALMKEEWKGVQHVADVIVGFNINSKETVFKKSTVNKIKGYSKEVFDDSILMEIAPLDDKKSMEAQGYQYKGTLADKTGLPKDKKMAIYVTDSVSRPERLRGGTRLNQIRAKGTSVRDSAYKAGEEFSNSYVKELAQRDINNIQKGAVARANLMEKGEYDFKDTVFGLRPVLNESGKVVDYTYNMDKATKKSLLKQDTRVSEVMSRSFGALLDKELSAEHNSKVLDELKKDMKNNWEEGEKGIDGLTDFTLIGPNVSDPEMRKLFYMLPKEFKDYANTREDKTIAVRTSLKNMYFGYSHLSIADFPMLKKVTPEILIKAIKIAEMVWMEFVQVAKTNILMKMPTVTISNFVSNVLYLTMKGYNPGEIITMQLESYREIKKYNNAVKREQALLNKEREIKVSLSRDNLPEKRIKERSLELQRTQGELMAVKKQIRGSRINELVEMGLDQSVEDINSGMVRDTNKISEFFDAKLENVPELARTGIDYLFLTKRSAPYKIVNEFLEVTDLMSRDIQNTMEIRTEERQASGDEMLPDWWLEGKPEGYKREQPLRGEERKDFLKQAEAIRKYDLVEDYINYTMPSSRFEEYLNKIGILMFTKYVKRIQRIIVKTGGKGPIKSLLGLTLAGELGGLPTIHEQSFFAKEWYTDTIGPGNVFPIYGPIDIFMNVITPSLLKESTYTL